MFLPFFIGKSAHSCYNEQTSLNPLDGNSAKPARRQQRTQVVTDCIIRLEARIKAMRFIAEKVFPPVEPKTQS